MSGAEESNDHIHMTKDFYDDMSKNYHLIFDNWDIAMEKQARVLQLHISNFFENSDVSILDCTCGIGTQTIGLGTLGYKVTGTDISPNAIERAIKESRARNLDIEYHVLDIRRISALGRSFEVIISIDNSLPHLIDDEEIFNALKAVRSCLKDEGVFIATTRDYDALIKERPDMTPPCFRRDDSGDWITCQVWNWVSQNVYEVHQHITTKTDGRWLHHHTVTLYRALQRSELEYFSREVGFKNVQWLLPTESGFYQPLMLAHSR